MHALGEIGFRNPAPVFAVRDLEAALAFYERLGFTTRRHDSGYAFAERDGLRLHLRSGPELAAPFSNYVEVYVEVHDPDALYEEWKDCGLLAVAGPITPELRAEVARRSEAGEPVGLISDRVEDKPWGVREFAVRDLDNNHLRLGRRIRRG